MGYEDIEVPFNLTWDATTSEARLIADHNRLRHRFSRHHGSQLFRVEELARLEQEMIQESAIKWEYDRFAVATVTKHHAS